MKRSELKVGDHLFYARPGDWQYAHFSSEAHVVVVAVEPYTRENFGRRKPYPTDKGTGVLVDVVNADGSTHYQRVVQLGHLRGPYEATKTEVDARRKARIEQQAVDRKAREAQQADTNAKLERMKAAGLPSVYERNARAAVVAFDEVLALLDKVEQLEREIADLKTGIDNGDALPGWPTRRN